MLLVFKKIKLLLNYSYGVFFIFFTYEHSKVLFLPLKAWTTMTFQMPTYKELLRKPLSFLQKHLQIWRKKKQSKK